MRIRRRGWRGVRRPRSAFPTRPRPLPSPRRRAVRPQLPAPRSPSQRHPLPRARDSEGHRTSPPEFGDLGAPRSSPPPGPFAPQPAIDPLDYVSPASREAGRASPEAGRASPEDPSPGDVRLEFGPWTKGPAWARAAGFLGFCLAVFAGCLFFGAIGWGFAVVGCGLGLALLLTLRAGLAVDPQARGYFHPGEGMSDRRWYRLQRSRIRRVGLRLQLLLSYVADWVLTFLWRQIRRLVRRRFR